MKENEQEVSGVDENKEALLRELWKTQQATYAYIGKYDSQPHSYGGNTLYRVEGDVLDLIADNPGITVTELGSILGRTPSACSQIVRKLRDKGWVEQIRNPANNRQFNLTLTESGEQVYREHVAYDRMIYMAVAQRLQDFTEEELGIYLRVQNAINVLQDEGVEHFLKRFTEKKK